MSVLSLFSANSLANLISRGFAAQNHLARGDKRNDGHQPERHNDGGHNKLGALRRGEDEKK